MMTMFVYAVGRRFGRGGNFPLRFSGKPPIGPIAVGLGLVPADMNYREIFIQRDILIEDALAPATVGFPLPIDRVLKSFFEIKRFPRFIDVFVKKFGKRTFQVGRGISL